MSIVFNCTEDSTEFLRVLRDYASISRGKVEVTFLQSPSEMVGWIKVNRLRDDDGDPRLLCAYRQVLSYEAAGVSEAWCLSGDVVKKILDRTAESWETLEVPKDVQGADKIEKSSTDFNLPLSRRQARVEGGAFTCALEAADQLPTLDVSEEGDLHLTASDSTLVIERRAGEVAFREKLPFLEAFPGNARCQVPPELISLISQDLRGNNFVDFLFPEDGGIGIHGSRGTFYFTDYGPSGRVAIESRSPLVAFVTLSRKELQQLEDVIHASKDTTAQSLLTLALDGMGIVVSSHQPGIVGLLEVKVPVSRLSMEEEVTLSFRPASILSVIAAAKRCDKEPYRFYFNRQGAFVFKGRQATTFAQAEKVDGFVAKEEKRLILWASGGSAELIVRSPHRHILISFAEFSNEVQKKEGEFERYLEKRGLLSGDMRIFLDSGAYSVWQAGAEVDLDEYMRFLRWNARFLDTYVALDVIRGAVRENVENYLRMVDAGLAPLYVWHLYEDWDLLEKLLDDHKEAIRRGGIGAGGAPHTPYPIREPYVGEFIRRVTAKVTTKIHLFGTTSEWLLKKYPMVYSADSTSWRFLGDNHLIETPFATFSTKPQSPKSLWNHRLCQEVSRFAESLPFRGVPFRMKDLAADRDTRHIYNLAYLSFFEEHYPYIDWMRLEHRFIPGDELKAKGKLNLDYSAIILPTRIQ